MITDFKKDNNRNSGKSNIPMLKLEKEKCNLKYRKKIEECGLDTK